SLPEIRGREAIGERERLGDVVSEQHAETDRLGYVVHLVADDLQPGRDGERTRAGILVEEVLPIPRVPLLYGRGDGRAVEMTIDLPEILQHEARVKVID